MAKDVKFFLDHDVPPEVARVLRQEGHDVIELRQVLPVQTSDSEVFAYVRENGLFLITCYGERTGKTFRIRVYSSHQLCNSRIMRTTLMLSDDVYVTVKKIAESSGRSLGEVVSQLIRKGLVSEPSFDIENDIPVFRVGPSDEPIPGGRAAELLDEES